MTRKSSKHLFVTYGTTGHSFSGHGNSIHPMIPLLKKEDVHLFPCPWGYNNDMDAYFQSSWEDMALEVTVSSVKSMDVTYMTHQVNWPRNCYDELKWRRLCAMWISSSVVEFRLCIGGDHGIHCWRNLIRSKQLFTASIWHVEVFTRFSGHGNLIYNIIPLL